MTRDLVKRFVADAGLLDPEAGTVGLDELMLDVDLWVAHSGAEYEMVRHVALCPVIRAPNRGSTVGNAMAYFKRETPNLSIDDVLFLVRRQRFIGPFTAGKDMTCGLWTRPVNKKGDKGFFKASVALGWCPARCRFCYLLGLPFRAQQLALNVGDYRKQIAQPRQIRNRRVKIPVVNLGETGGLLEWARVLGLTHLVQVYLDATLQAGVVPYILTKRALPDLNMAGAHVGISLNPYGVMKEYSPGASTPGNLLDFLKLAKVQGASTVIRLGPIFPGMDKFYHDVYEAIYRMGFGDGRITVDLLRFTPGHPEIEKYPNFSYRAHKVQEPPEVQAAHLRRIRDVLPDVHLTGCKLDPKVATAWVRSGLIRSMPCACWI